MTKRALLIIHNNNPLAGQLKNRQTEKNYKTQNRAVNDNYNFIRGQLTP